MIFGFVEELIERGGPFIHRYRDFPKRPETHWFDPEGMRVVFQKVLDEFHVRTICNLKAVESIVEGGRIRGVLVDTKTGRKAVLGRIVIDATGDGDVAANAGVPFDFGRPGDGLVQGMTMMYELRDVDEAAVRAVAPSEVGSGGGGDEEAARRGEVPAVHGAGRAALLRTRLEPRSLQHVPGHGQPAQ